MPALPGGSERLLMFQGRFYWYLEGLDYLLFTHWRRLSDLVQMFLQ
jgi:hypothetical protein